MIQFPTKLSQIQDRIKAINPTKYAQTRNFLDGEATYLSPYFTAGVISLKEVYDQILTISDQSKSEKLIMELAWREYFQRVWENKKDKIWTDLKNPASNLRLQPPKTLQKTPNGYKIILPKSILEQKTGILAIDNQLKELQLSGYMHNHARMWLASIVCNLAGLHWEAPSRWLYYNLLDGDLASNTLSWQWVAGTFSSKKYFANQENLNKYSKTHQTQTFLDKTYQELTNLTKIPNELLELSEIEIKTDLDYFQKLFEPKSILDSKKVLEIDPKQPIFLFHPYNLNPRIPTDKYCLKILIMDPEYFKSYPISNKRLDFIADLTKEIPQIQVFIGSPEELARFTDIQTTFNQNIDNWKDKIPNLKLNSPDYLFPQVDGYYPSFFGYYKRCSSKTWQKPHQS
jgi:deoxyribodipyrimidine photo-lyase